MRVDEIRRVQRAEPFQPFVIHLADGREFAVDHPEFMWMSRSNRTLIVDDVEGNIELIDPVMVTSLTIPAGRSGDGARKDSS
jgi:hypothetical protein